MWQLIFMDVKCRNTWICELYTNTLIHRYQITVYWLDSLYLTLATISAKDYRWSTVKYCELIEFWNYIYLCWLSSGITVFDRLVLFMFFVCCFVSYKWCNKIRYFMYNKCNFWLFEALHFSGGFMIIRDLTPDVNSSRILFPIDIYILGFNL